VAVYFQILRQSLGENVGYNRPSLLSFLRAHKLHGLESQRPPAHVMTGALVRDMIKGTPRMKHVSNDNRVSVRDSNSVNL
jgi:hypothetical protein